jgi:hypothetical protein
MAPELFQGSAHAFGASIERNLMLTWNERNQLAQAHAVPYGSTSIVDESYLYDAFGRRRQKTVTVGSGGGDIVEVGLTVPLPADADPELVPFGPSPLSIGRAAAMALGKAAQKAVQSRAAHRAEQRLVRRLAREFGLESPRGRELLHDLLQQAKHEGVQGDRSLREWIRSHLQ